VRCITWRAISAWPDPSALFRALGAETVRRRAGEGDREAQWSLGCCLLAGAYTRSRFRST